MSFPKVMLVFFFVRRKAVQIINFLKTSQHVLKINQILLKKTNAFLNAVIEFCLEKNTFIIKIKAILINNKGFLLEMIAFLP